jgi:hypothetical protein
MTVFVGVDFGGDDCVGVILLSWEGRAAVCDCGV